MPLPEITLPIANVCVALHPKGKLFNILKEMLYDNNIIDIN